MTLPEPVPGLVVHHAFLWSHEQHAGRDEARKHRPAAIILALAQRGSGQRVYLLAITHAPPTTSGKAIEIPAAIKRHLGLDSGRSWIVLDEVNDFIWPGFDLRPIPGTAPPRADYGVLPPSYFARVRDAFLAVGLKRRIKRD